MSSLPNTAQGGYKLLEKCRSGKLSFDTIVKELKDGGLRGLGGAGFPTGRKWQIVRSYPGPRLMTINGDEGEPGTFKDRYYLERNPHPMFAVSYTHLRAHETKANLV